MTGPHLPARVESGSGTRPRDEGREAYQVDVGYLEDAGPPLSEIYDIGFNRVPVLAKSAF